MPIFRETDAQIPAPAGILPGSDQPERDPAFFSETIPAAFRQENTVGSFMVGAGQGRGGPIDQNYDPFEDIDGFEEFAPRFSYAKNKADVELIKGKIKQELEDRATLAAAGWAGVAAGFMAGTIDPVNFIPVGGQAYRTFRTGGSILRNGLSTARAGLIGSTASEALLYHTQETRTIDESFANVATATFLSGVLGGTVGVVRRSLEARRAGRLYDKTEADLTAQARSPDEAVEVALSGLEKDLEKVMLDAGSVVSDAFGNPVLKQNGEIRLKQNYGISKIIVKHGTKSPDAADPETVHLIVTRDDVTAIPKVFRNYEAEVFDNPSVGHKEWRWVVDRPGQDGAKRQVVYSVRRFTAGDGKDHVVTVYAPRPGKEFDQLSERRRSALSASLSGLLRISEGYRNGAYRFAPKGAEGAAPNHNIGNHGPDVTPWDDLQRQVERDMEVPPEGSPDWTEPGFVKINKDEMAMDTGQGLVEEALDSDDLPPIERPEMGEGGSIGAASTREGVAEEKLKSALGMEKAVRFADPLLRLATSPSIEARRVIQELAETPLAYEKNALGVATPIAVETHVKMWQAPLYEALSFMDDAFIRYRLGRKRRFGDVAKLGAKDLLGRGEQGVLDYTAFREEVGRAMRRNDEHHIPEVAEAARRFREKVFDPLKDKAIETGTLPEGISVETAASYLNRMYDHEKIVARRNEFTEIVARWLRTQEDKVDWDDLELLDLADEITDRVLGTPDGRLPYDAFDEARDIARGPNRNTKRGPLQSRVFNIPDRLIEDFLESDIEVLAKSYTRTMAPDVEIMARFEKLGLDDQLRDVAREFDQKIAQAASEGARNKLNRQKDAAIRDIAAVRDRIRHTYALPSDPSGLISRTFRFIRNLNYLRLLGGMTFTAIPDMGRAVMVHGYERVVGDGIVPMVRNFKSYRIASNEVKLAGTALDMVLDTRSMGLADVLDDYGRRTVIERGIGAATDKFGAVTLMAPWNAAMKQFSGIVTMARMLEAAEAAKAGTISTKELEKLAHQGIDQSMAARIAEQFEQYGDIVDGVRMANTAEWVDREAVQAFRAGLVKEVDRIVVTPGQDKPLWMSSEAGKVIGQFKSFAFASTQRALLSGLQQRDLAALNGSTLMIGLGMVSYAVKSWDAGRELSEDPAVWLAEGVDKSGLTGWLFEANNMLEKATRGTVGLSALTGQQISRYASRNILGALVGPTAGTVQDLTQVTGSLSTGDWRASDTRALRRLIPYQNLLLLRQLLDEAEKGINEAIGAK